MALIPLNTEHINTYYDSELKLLIVSYHGILSADITKQFYQWLIPTMQTNPHLITEARGSIFDFRDVQEFQASNITTTRRESGAASQTADISNHPVALIVDTMLQERMVESTMRLTVQRDRKRVVHSIDEAVEFINEWHQENKE